MSAPIKLNRKEDCCGCSACYSICPINCITMEFDHEGFSYPSIDSRLCIGCGKCASVCPLKDDNAVKGIHPVQAAYVATNNDNAVRSCSTSGGAFSVLANQIVARSGIVVGACFDETLSVVHDLASNMDDAKRFYGSKYVQSNLHENDIYTVVREKLSDGVPVLFSGTPCQVHGLFTFLKKDYDNLYTCDFICRAVPSPKVWQTYLLEMQDRFNAKVQTAAFRHKTYGYHSSTMKLVFEDGNEYYGSGRVDPMLKSFFAGLICRPSCYECRFRHVERSSDFTIFDCWSYSEITAMEDDNLGHTQLWIHTDKGQSLLEACRENVTLIPEDVEEVLAGDGKMALKNPPRHPQREAFLKTAFELSLDSAIKKYAPVTFVDRVLEATKPVLHRFGLLNGLSVKKKQAVRKDSNNG